MASQSIRRFASTGRECTLVVGSSENATLLTPEFVGQVALACTSPPYSNAISYRSHSADPEVNYRDRPAINYADYLAGLDRVWDATWTMLRPGGYLAVNAGTVLENGFHTPLPQDLLMNLLDAPEKWDYVRTIIWNKVTAGVKRAGSVIQHPLPGYWHPNIMTEHIVLVRKPLGRRARNPIDTRYPSEWNEDVWDIAPVPPRQVPHPAPFPEEIPHRLIRMLTKEGDLVMDPFNGAGATTKASWDLNRASLGFDLEDEYVTHAGQRLGAESSIRKNQLLVVPIPASDFVPRAPRASGSTRHGAGLNARRRAKAK